MGRRAALGVVLAALASCSREEDPPSADRPDLTLEGVTLRHTRAGQLRVVAHTPRLEMYRFSGDLRAQDASVTISRGELQLDLALVTGSLQSGVLVGHDVSLRAPDGTRATSPQLTWFSQRSDGGLVTSDAGVQLNRPGLAHTASGFTLDLASEHAEFNEPSTLVTSAP